MWEGSRSSQTECVPAGGVTGQSVPTHQRWLCLLYLHCTFVKLCRLLEIALFVAYEIKAEEKNCDATFMIKLLISRM